jgi:hypothetical protein
MYIVLLYYSDNRNLSFARKGVFFLAKVKLRPDFRAPKPRIPNPNPKSPQIKQNYLQNFSSLCALE